MKVLITGAGMIGSQVAKLIVESGETPILFDISPNLSSLQRVISLDKVKVVKGDILNLPELISLFNSEKIDAVIHTVANPLLSVGAQRNPYAAIKINVFGTINVLEAARLTQVRKLVFSSSSTVYGLGSKQGEPFSEDAKLGSGGVYASTKIACENFIRNYAMIYGIEYVITRIAAVFGPWPGGGVVSESFASIIKDSQSGSEATVPLILAEYVYSKDAAHALVLALRAEKLKNREFNVGMQKMYEPNDIMEILKEIFPKTKVNIVTQGQPMWNLMDYKQARDELGFKPRFDLKDALLDFASELGRA